MFQNIGADRKNYHKLKTFTNSLEQKNSREVRKIGYTRLVPQKIFGTVRQNCDPPPHPNKIFGTLKTLKFKMVSFSKVDPRCGFNLVQCIYNGNFYSKTLLFNWYCSFNLGYFGNWVFWRWVFWISGILALVILGLWGGTPEYIRKARLGLLRRLPVVESEKTRQYYEQQSITRYSSLQKRSFKMP